MKEYSRMNEIPSGSASDHYTPGILVLEGGAWRGMYTQGALDAMMEEDLNLSTVIGVSAGALSALSYISGQIGRSARTNLRHRHDSGYTGLSAVVHDHGVTGFNYLFNVLNKEEPLDEERFNDPRQRFIAAVTDITTGKQVYFEKGKCSDIFKAVQASATVPYVSEAVEIDGSYYLDGGIAMKIPLDWAMNEPEKKIVIIRTRDRKYRKPLKAPLSIINLEYSRRYPNLASDLAQEAPRYNSLLNRIDQLEASGRVFVLAPSQPVEISRFEGDVEALGNLYWLGYHDARQHIQEMKHYLAS